MMLLNPDLGLIAVFNSFWTDEPLTHNIKLFEDGEVLDVSKYISQFKNYEKEDQEIYQKASIFDFLESINSAYHTRVSGIKSIVGILSEKGITDVQQLRTCINDNKLLFADFVAICKLGTGKYTYSFASKVFCFINCERFPIIDSIVVAILDKYDFKNKINKSKWGDYSKYIDNYDAFIKAYNLSGKSYKEIDRFLWTYGKILADYWADMGVLSYEPVMFDPNTISK